MFPRVRGASTLAVTVTVGFEPEEVRSFSFHLDR
jgi:hypothetical protein